jgi:glycosyltransferase EpsH
METIVSVIIPVYNTACYLERCLQSLADQTFTRFEAIVVDDGSTDGSGDVCDGFAAKDARFRVFHRLNAGVVATRKFAQQQAQGKYFAWLDSDDWLHPEFLERMTALAEREGLDITWCDVTYVWARKQQVYHVAYSPDNHEMIRRMLRGEVTGWLWNKLVRRDYYLTCQIHQQNGANVMEDIYQSIQLLAHPARTGQVDCPLYFYNRTNEASYTARSGKNPYAKAIDNMRLTYDFLVTRGLYREFGNDFCTWVMRAKIAFLLSGDLRHARGFMPFAHRHLTAYKPYTSAYASPVQSLIKSLNFWVMFYLGFVGRLWYALYLHQK